jgi:hypothetical protein
MDELGLRWARPSCSRLDLWAGFGDMDHPAVDHLRECRSSVACQRCREEADLDGPEDLSPM